MQFDHNACLCQLDPAPATHHSSASGYTGSVRHRRQGPDPRDSSAGPGWKTVNRARDRERAPPGAAVSNRPGPGHPERRQPPKACSGSVPARSRQRGEEPSGQRDRERSGRFPRRATAPPRRCHCSRRRSGVRSLRRSPPGPWPSRSGTGSRSTWRGPQPGTVR